MKRTILLLFSLTLLLFADPAKKQLLSPQETLNVLDGLDRDAIVIGHGKKVVHAFIDPLCPLSQMYMRHLYEHRDRMFEKYSIHLYLLELHGKHSGGLIRNILASDRPEEILKCVMVNHDPYVPEPVKSAPVEETVQEITRAAEKIGVYKRPYIIINGKAK